MQSYSQIVDPSLSAADLPTLGSRLSLPAGWSFSVVQLSADFQFTGVLATVIQDNLENSYTKMYRADCVACGPDTARPSGGLTTGALVGIVVAAALGGDGCGGDGCGGGGCSCTRLSPEGDAKTTKLVAVWVHHTATSSRAARGSHDCSR